MVTTHLTTTAASAAAVALLFPFLASASHPMIMSHNTSDFKFAYEDTGIVPEVVASIDPQCSFYFSYREKDNDKALMMPGHVISLYEAQQMPFEFSVEGLQNVTEATSQSRYLIYIADVDAPDRNDPTARNMRYFLGGNFTVDGDSEVLDTAQKLVNQSLPYTEFVNPDPQLGTGVHRFLSALYIQPDRFNSEGFETVMNRTRAGWNLSEWRNDLGLGPAIGATVWMVNTTNAQVLNAAPGLAVSSWTMMGSLSAALFGAFALL